jgi:hypothetical protein
MDVKVLQQNLDEIRNQLAILKKELSEQQQYLIETEDGKVMKVYGGEVEIDERT